MGDPLEIESRSMFMLTKKMIVKGHYPKTRLEKFSLLIEVAENLRRKNQYQ